MSKHPVNPSPDLIPTLVSPPGPVNIPGESPHFGGPYALAGIGSTMPRGPYAYQEASSKVHAQARLPSAAYNEVPIDYGRPDINVMDSVWAETRGVKSVKKRQTDSSFLSLDSPNLHGIANAPTDHGT